MLCISKVRVPVIADNFTDALVNNNDCFLAEINRCVDPYGNNYGGGWQYFTSVVRSIDKLTEEKIISDFVKYLELTVHTTAYDGFRLRLRGSEKLKDYSPACLPFLTPWSNYDLARIEERAAGIVKDEKLLLISDAVRTNPLKDPKYLAETHYRRLIELRNSVVTKGYNLSKNYDDPVLGHVLTRGCDHRILIFSGQHRIAVLAGLDHDFAPVCFANKYIINEAGVDDWPLVRKGVWDREDALLYYNHLFDFNSRAWAEEFGFPV